MKNSKIFRNALFADIGCLALDILSIFGIIYCKRGVSPVVTEILCKLYLMSLVCITYFSFIYVVSQMPVTEKGGKKIDRAALIIYMVADIAIAALPISYTTDGRLTYSYGPSCQAAYFFAPFYIIVTFLMVLYYRKKIPVNFFVTITVAVALECGIALIQLLNPEILLVGFGTSLGLLVIYLEIENPMIQTDRLSGLFNLSTFYIYLEDFYKKDLPFSYIFVRLEYDLAAPVDKSDMIMRRMADYLASFRKAKTFYIGQSAYVMVFRDPTEAAKTAGEINPELINACADNGNAFLEVLETRGRRAASVTEMQELLSHVSANGEYSDNNIVTMNDDVYERFRQERRITAEIDKALDEDRVEAFFQPIYSLKDNAFTGAEALVRIRKEDGTIMPPAMFIPVAEKTGQVTTIGDRMFEKTLGIIKSGGIRELGVRFIDINLSVLQCEDKTLSDRYLSKMKEAGVPPEMFCFEITETAMIVNREMLLNNLNAFRAAGCSCSLDDFGNGESNLNYVVDMPINFIKADRSMVTKYSISSRVGLIMDSMIHMAKGLSLKVVAEGVETDKDLEAMKNLDIDYIQGYYFSKPLPKNEYIRFLMKKRKSA
ncbi:MAG: EAL domain-containing protein [Candidatus Weimeria sp.]